MGLNADAGRLLDQINLLQHPSDLDLLIFFAKHPRALLPSEHLVRFLGYGAKEIAASLDLLLEAGFLSRTPNPKHAARMYVFAPAPPVRDGLVRLLQLASTRNGRLALISALRGRSSDGTNASAQDGTRQKNGALTPLSFPNGRTSRMDARRTDVDAKAGSRRPRKQGGHDGVR